LPKRQLQAGELSSHISDKSRRRPDIELEDADSWQAASE
jgi:hypothetical protein